MISTPFYEAFPLFILSASNAKRTQRYWSIYSEQFDGCPDCCLQRGSASPSSLSPAVIGFLNAVTIMIITRSNRSATYIKWSDLHQIYSHLTTSNGPASIRNTSFSSAPLICHTLISGEYEPLENKWRTSFVFRLEKGRFKGFSRKLTSVLLVSND